MRTFATACFFFLALQGGRAQNDDAKIALTVPPGTPLRVYLTKRAPRRLGAPVEGKLIEPVFAFDHEVLPAGSALMGKVSFVHPVSKGQRFRAIVNGDFTPLRNAQLEFDSVVLPNGTLLPLHTGAATALNSLYIEPSTKVRKTQAPQNPNNGVLGTAKKKLKDQIHGALNAGSGGFADIVRGPNKKEKLVDFLWAKMPYHPQLSLIHISEPT